jgi:tripartite-type tricarboxylate transporter receptor subunit TctC
VNTNGLSFIKSLVFFGLTLANSVQAQSNPWPNKPIRMIIGSPAGSGTDAVSRMVGNKVSEALGQVFIMENKAGAGGQIATELISKGVPDGYTLISISSAHASQAATLKNLPYDPVDGLTWISTVGVYPFLLAVSADASVQSIPDLIKKAKADPGSVTYTTSGVGSALHLVGELLAAETDTKMTHIPFPAGGGFGYTDILAGRIDMMINIPGLIVPYVRANKLKAIAVTSAQRYDTLPNVPTLSEYIPGFEVISWLGIAAPPGIPTEVVKKINSAIKVALASKDLQAQMQKAGVQPQSTTPEEFHTIVEKGIEKYKKIADSRHIEIQP